MIREGRHRGVLLAVGRPVGRKAEAPVRVAEAVEEVCRLEGWGAVEPAVGEQVVGAGLAGGPAAPRRRAARRSARRPGVGDAEACASCPMKSWLARHSPWAGTSARAACRKVWPEAW